MPHVFRCVFFENRIVLGGAYIEKCDTAIRSPNTNFNSLRVRFYIPSSFMIQGLKLMLTFYGYDNIWRVSPMLLTSG